MGIQVWLDQINPCPEAAHFFQVCILAGAWHSPNSMLVQKCRWGSAAWPSTSPGRCGAAALICKTIPAQAGTVSSLGAVAHTVLPSIALAARERGLQARLVGGSGRRCTHQVNGWINWFTAAQSVRYQWTYPVPPDEDISVIPLLSSWYLFCDSLYR